MSAHWAPLGYPLPDSAGDPLGPGFVDLGHVGDLVLKTEASSRDVFTWGGSVVATLQDSFSCSVGFTMSAASAPALPGGDAGSWVLDAEGVRVVVPVGRIVVPAPGGKVTLKAFPDLGGNSVYRYADVRTWEETWDDYVSAALEGRVEAAALLAELVSGRS